MTDHAGFGWMLLVLGLVSGSCPAGVDVAQEALGVLCISPQKPSIQTLDAVFTGFSCDALSRARCLWPKSKVCGHSLIPCPALTESLAFRGRHRNGFVGIAVVILAHPSEMGVFAGIHAQSSPTICPKTRF
jgi:hypothetical protein